MPQTRYVDSGGVHIAYQVVGEGATDILFVPGLISHIELAWEDPATAAFYTRLAAMGRLILFDKRDTGLSDRTPGDFSLDQRIDDATAVMDAVDSHRAIVFGYSEGAPMAILLAATHPDRVSALILGSAFARWFPAPDYPCGPAAETVYAAMEDIAKHRWGQGDTIEWFAPSRAGSAQARQALGRLERMAISPSTVLRMLQLIRDIDVRAALPAIHVPTLVIHRHGDRINPPFHGRYLAEHIPGARYFEQPGDHVLRFAESDELDSMFAQIQDFLADATRPPESDPGPHHHPDRRRDKPTVSTGGHPIPRRGRANPRRPAVFWPPSTRPAGPSAAPSPFETQPQPELRGCVLVSTPGKSTSSAMRSAGPLCPSPTQCAATPRTAKSSCRVPSRTFSSDRESDSRTGARTCSPAPVITGRYSASAAGEANACLNSSPTRRRPASWRGRRSTGPL